MRRLAGIVILAAVATVASLYVYTCRPLIRTDAWLASYSQEGGQAQQASVYALLFRPERLFVHVPNARVPRYRWFALDLESRKISAPSWPPSKPYLYAKQDSLGILLDFPKIEDQWRIEWQADTVRFSNASLDVQLTRK